MKAYPSRWREAIRDIALGPCENSNLNGRRADQKTVRLLNKNGCICCMQHTQGGDRNQTLLLPAAVDDYIGQENPVRFIEAFVDQCDLHGPRDLIPSNATLAGAFSHGLVPF